MPISKDYPAVLKARKRRDKALPLLIIDLEADSPLLATLRTALKGDRIADYRLHHI